MRRLVGLALGACVFAACGQASAFDALTVDGALVCDYPSKYAEAEKAVMAGDTKWLASTGCVALKAGVKITIIEPGNQYQGLSRARFVEQEVTAYVGRWHYIKVAVPYRNEGVGEADAASLNKSLAEYLHKCAGDRSAPPQGYEDFGVTFYAFESFTGWKFDPVAVVYSDALGASPELIAFAKKAVEAFREGACSIMKGKAITSQMKRLRISYVTVTLSPLP